MYHNALLSITSFTCENNFDMKIHSMENIVNKKQSHMMSRIAFYFFAAVLAISSIHISFCAAPQPGALPTGMPQLSPAEQKQLETEMAAFQEEFSKLSPQEQESFYESMDEAVQKIEELSQTEEGKELLDKLDKGDISDDELDLLINTLVGEEEEAERVPEEEKMEEKPKEPAKPKMVLTSKHEQAIDAINSLIRHTNAFLVKVATMPTFPNSFAQWIKKGTLTLPESARIWTELKKNIEQLVSQLHTLLEQDPKTEEYYHIDGLLKNEAFYNNLRKVETTIAQQEPNVEELSPLHKKISASSKKAIQAMLTQYAEALYTLKLPEELATLLKAFEPKAKESREAEEKAAQTAAKSRDGLTPGRPIVAGTPEHDRGYFPESRTYPTGTSRMAPQTYIPEAPYPSGKTLQPSTAAPRGGKSQQGRTHVRAADDKKTVIRAAKEDAALPEGVDKGIRLPSGVVSKKRQEVDHLINTIKDTITAAAKTVNTSATLKTLEAHLRDESPVDITLVTELIPDTIRELSVRKGAVGKIEELNRKITTPSWRTTYQKKLTDLYTPHKSTFENLEKQITAIQSKFDAMKASITPEKLYAYFGIEVEPQPPELSEVVLKEALDEVAREPLSEEAKIEKAIEYVEEQQVAKPSEGLIELERKLPAPVSLFDLRDSITALKKSIEGFDRGAPINKAPAKKK